MVSEGHDSRTISCRPGDIVVVWSYTRPYPTIDLWYPVSPRVTRTTFLPRSQTSSLRNLSVSSTKVCPLSKYLFSYEPNK